LVINPLFTDTAATATAGATTNNSPAAQFSGLSGASKALMRVGQLEPGQYASPDEYKVWAYSACSAAAMTEVINAYGHNYRITDILRVEIRVKAITPELGLLEPSGIDRTVSQFGFKTVWLKQPSLDDVIKIANDGRPVIVSWPPERWAGGHILVLRGGNAQNVYLADSSKLNYQVMSRARFSQLWAGFSVVVVPK
ncbi:MAG: C39 family peptidase, partial [Ktedonobacteraceae bacterium]|nr:C39 family peptidase [Ktedonobacteraceae bacterium]